MMKFIDKFLKKLNTNRNTFACYILTLITLYIVVDRVVEIVLMLFTGVSYSYWNPWQYALALICPMFAFAFCSTSSDFSETYKDKVSMFYFYFICLGVIATSMFTQWLNMAGWLLLISNPGYVDIVTKFSELVRPAFSALTILFPMFIAIRVFNFLYFGVMDSMDMIRSIWDYRGIDLSDSKGNSGQFTNELYLFKDFEYGRIVKMPESARYMPTLVCGGSGTGKTSLLFEPMIAKDIERKYLFRETAKELGFTALKTGIASLKAPYGNEYLNKNFSLNFLVPNSGKEEVYKAFMKKMILDSSSSDIVYRNCGVTVMAPDMELIDHMVDVANNFGLSYNIIDPNNSNSVGMNPFVYDEPHKIATAISSIIKAMYNTNHNTVEDAYREDFVMQAIENIAILLKEIYPKMNEGKLPNIEDMLKMLTNFDLVEKMCEIMSRDEKYKNEYSIQIAYFKKHFYKDGTAKAQTEKDVYAAASQLDNLLRLPGVKSIICNRTNNMDFDKMLNNGEITFICTRRGDLGPSSTKAFGLFFLISMQNAILRRHGNEKNRIPNFLYIDEFSDFIGKAIEPIFTMYRKYKVGTVISIQNLSQLDISSSKEKYRNLILANCANKIFTGHAPADELEWWEKEFSNHREWVMSNSMDMNKMEYDPKRGGVSWKFVPNMKVGKLQSFGLKDCGYEIRNSNGKPTCGLAKMSFLDSKYKEPSKIKTYDFGKYSDRVTTATEDDNDLPKKSKFDPKNLNFIDDRNEIDPVQTDTTDAKYVFDNEDAIVVNFKKPRNNN